MVSRDGVEIYRSFTRSFIKGSNGKVKAMIRYIVIGILPTECKKSRDPID
jgi:hypothetical protein